MKSMHIKIYKFQCRIIFLFTTRDNLFTRNALTPKFRVDLWNYKNFTVADMVLYILKILIIQNDLIINADNHENITRVT